MNTDSNERVVETPQPSREKWLFATWAAPLRQAAPRNDKQNDPRDV